MSGFKWPKIIRWILGDVQSPISVTKPAFYTTMMVITDNFVRPKDTRLRSNDFRHRNIDLAVLLRREGGGDTGVMWWIVWKQPVVDKRSWVRLSRLRTLQLLIDRRSLIKTCCYARCITAAPAIHHSQKKLQQLSAWPPVISWGHKLCLISHSRLRLSADASLPTSRSQCAVQFEK